MPHVYLPQLYGIVDVLTCLQVPAMTVECGVYSLYCAVPPMAERMKITISCQCSDQYITLALPHNPITFYYCYYIFHFFN